MKKKQIRINFVDYLYYTIGREQRGVKVILIPLLWVFLLIVMHIKRPLHIGWCIFFAVLAGLADYGFCKIYDKRGSAVRKYFDKTRYAKAVWKWSMCMIWFVVWGGVVPFVIIKLL